MTEASAGGETRAADVPDAPATAGEGRSRRRRLVEHAGAIGTLLALSLWMCARAVLTGHPTSTVLCQCGDPGQAVWFLAWVPYAISHGLDPFFTNRMLAGQGGANLLDSTSYLLPATLLAPVTWLFGATAAFNVALVAGPVLSGWSLFLAAGRLAGRFLPRLLGAVVYAFSPFFLQEEIYGHLNFTWLWFPPVLFLLLHEILTGDRVRPVVAGGLLGLAVTAQYFTGTEPLLITVVAAVAGVLVAAALAPRALARRWRRIVVAGVTAAGVTGLLLAYPLWYALDGPRHVAGAPWPGTSVFGDTIASSVSPGPLVHRSTVFTRIGGYLGPTGPSLGYLGWALVAALAVAAVLAVWRRQRAALAVAATGLFAWACSLGIFLLPLGADSTQFWLPWRYLHTLGLLADVAPQRFVLVVTAAGGLLLAAGLDLAAGLVGRTPSTGGHHRRAGRWPALPVAAPAALCLAVGAAVIVPVATTYTWPLTMGGGVTPEWFARTAPTLPSATSVLTYPFASSPAPQAMYWQAEESLSFRLVGGRALIPGGDGVHSLHVTPIRGTTGLLTNDSVGTGIPPTPSAVQVEALAYSLRHWKVDLVVVAPQGNSPAWALAFFAEAVGRLPTIEQGVGVFDLRLRPGRAGLYPPAVVARCDQAPATLVGLELARACLSRAGPPAPV